MKGRIIALAFALCLLPAVAHAQSRTMHEQLMPTQAALTLTAHAQPVSLKLNTIEPVMISRGGGMGYMLAGAALFIAGLVVDGDAGTIMVLAGAGIGAYGLYVHFR
ncbi:MAG TPA: hypothetical protein VM100_14015 [Longimicrobiales bacterium]|nr:hypothetical protein [Longimicrobiales bacterium]